MNNDREASHEPVKQPITRDTWLQFFRNEIDEDQSYLMPYMYSREVVTKFLDNLIQSSASDAEIVSKLMTFVKESHQLINHFNGILYSSDAQKYGLINPDGPLSPGQPENTPNQ